MIGWFALTYADAPAQESEERANRETAVSGLTVFFFCDSIKFEIFYRCILTVINYNLR